MASKKSNDIDKYEQDEAKKENAEKNEPKIDSVLDGVEVPEFDLQNIEDLGEALDQMGAFIMACSWKLASRTMNGYKISPDDDYKITSMQKQFKIIQSTYNSMIKMGRIDDSNTAGAKAGNKDFLDKIKKQSGSIGGIVKTMGKAANK